LKVCKNCIQPDSRPGIFFTTDGICGACVWEKEKQLVDWKSRENELHDIVNLAKKNSHSQYDCAVGVSGGKDSTFQAIFARDKLNLNCLLVNCEPNGITEIGKHNIENLKNLGFDVLSIRPKPDVLQKLTRHDFFQHLNPVKASEFPLYCCTYIIADKFSIPLIIQGENPGLTLGTRLTGVGTNYDALNADQLNTLSKGHKEYLDVKGITEKDLFWFHYDSEKLRKNKTIGIWLNYFDKDWSQQRNAEFSKSKGLKWRENFEPDSIGTYVPWAQLDTDFTQVNQMFKFIKFGFGQCMDHVCYDIRENRMNKEDGIKYVFKYDGKCSDEFLQKFCNYIDISKEELSNTIEKFRGDMWYKESEVWKNKIHDQLKEELK